MSRSGLATLALAGFAIRESRESAGPRRIDIPGVITSAVTLFALTFALIEGHDRGWTSPLILTLVRRRRGVWASSSCSWNCGWRIRWSRCRSSASGSSPAD